MTRDGFNGSTPTTVTQTRQFEYAGAPGARVLWKTTFPENGVTEYGYQGKLLMSKKNRNGVWMYFLEGPSVAIQHFHCVRQTLRDVGLQSLEMSITPDKLIVNITQRNGNVWLLSNAFTPKRTR
jgi:hypothetical protein